MILAVNLPKLFVYFYLLFENKWQPKCKRTAAMWYSLGCGFTSVDQVHSNLCKWIKINSEPKNWNKSQPPTASGPRDRIGRFSQIGLPPQTLQA